MRMWGKAGHETTEILSWLWYIGSVCCLFSTLPSSLLPQGAGAAVWEATEALVSTARQASAAAKATRLSPELESEEMEVR